MENKDIDIHNRVKMIIKPTYLGSFVLYFSLANPRAQLCKGIIFSVMFYYISSCSICVLSTIN